MSGKTYGNIERKYLRLVKDFNKDITVVFYGYKPSPKDHGHNRGNKSLSLNIIHNLYSLCTITKARFLANSHNKTQMILLLPDVLGRNGMEVLLADDDADTLIVNTDLSRNGLARDVEVRVEGTDVFCLLIHHYLKTNCSLFVSTKAFIREEGGCLQIITLNVIVSNMTTVNVITQGEEGVSIWPNIDNVICEQSFTAIA